MVDRVADRPLGLARGIRTEGEDAEQDAGDQRDQIWKPNER